MAALLTLDIAKRHLRVDHSDDDADITRKIEQASEAVINYIKMDYGWTPDTVPADVAAAVELMLSKLYDDRAGGAAVNEMAMGYLTLEITSLLHRWRNPALA